MDATLSSLINRPRLLGARLAEEGFLAPYSEPVSVTDINTLSPLSQTPWPVRPLPSCSWLTAAGSSIPRRCRISGFQGRAITWLSTVYSVSPGDEVVAVYYYVM